MVIGSKFCEIEGLPTRRLLLLRLSPVVGLPAVLPVYTTVNWQSNFLSNRVRRLLD